jgi:hypothetical protein
MSQSRALALTVLVVGCLAPLTGCEGDGTGGDPGPAFSTGTAGHHNYGGSGYAGATSSGYAGSSAAGGTGTVGTPDGGAAGAGGGAGGTTGSPDGSTGTQPSACSASATATFSLAWSLEDATGANATCDAVGGVTVDIDIVNLTSGAETAATFPCAALAATTCAMPAGQYSIAMTLHDASGAPLSDVFAPLLFLVEGKNTPVASLPLQVGGDTSKGRGLALTWSIDRLSSGAIQSCAQANAATVEVRAGTTTFDLPCADGKGRTTAIAAGSYPVTLDLLDGAGGKLSETQTMNIAIAAGQLVFLGDVPFDIN